MPAKSNTHIRNLALSVRQPFAEQIMIGEKKIEYRSKPTNIRERIYVYASKTPNKEAFRKIKKELSDFPVGVLVGTVEIVDCKEKSDEYHLLLANPQRLKKPMKADNRPQPVWFKPFKEK